MGTLSDKIKPFFLAAILFGLATSGVGARAQQTSESEPALTTALGPFPDHRPPGLQREWCRPPGRARTVGSESANFLRRLCVEIFPLARAPGVMA